MKKILYILLVCSWLTQPGCAFLIYYGEHERPGLKEKDIKNITILKHHLDHQKAKENSSEITLQLRHMGDITSLAFCPCGRYLISGSMDKTAKLWDVQTGTMMRTFAGHIGAIRSVAISNDGRYLLTGSQDLTIRLWEISSGKTAAIFDTSDLAKTFVQDATSYLFPKVQFSQPDNKYVLGSFGRNGKGTKIWDLKDGESQIQSPYNEITFFPDGKTWKSWLSLRINLGKIDGYTTRKTRVPRLFPGGIL